MVKGISRQVIVVQSPDPQLFEQAIFILKDGARQEVSDEVILREAQRAIRGEGESARKKYALGGLAWAGCGAFATGLIWLICALL